MAIRFLNINSGEEAVAETEPQISAMWASSDHSPNITQGQDFGWRMAPEVLVEMKQIKQDIPVLQQIAITFKKPFEDIKDTDVLAWISLKSTPETAPIASEGDYQDAYDQEVRRLSKAAAEAKQAEITAAAGQSNTILGVESLADLEKRVALEERLAAARAVPETPTTTTTTTEETPTTTTTTTVKPVSNPTTTTTTTKVK